MDRNFFFCTFSTSRKPNITSGIEGTSYPYVRVPHIQNSHNPSLSRFEVFPNAQTFCDKSEPLFSTQYSDLFVIYTDGFHMQTGQPKPQSVINDHISDKIVFNNSNNKFMYPALNVSNIFATIDYDAHLITKLVYTINAFSAPSQYKN